MAATPSAPGNPVPSQGPRSLSHEELPRQFGKYTLLRDLASGGMARVYLAIQRAVAGFEKLVVIKRILPELSRDPGFVEMLLSEARTAATLNHPNIVQTFDVGEVDGTYYIAMEHINGEDIRSIVRAMKRAGVSEFPLEHTLSIILGTCAGLAYAHEKRDLDGRPMDIVHRDISPQNILITFTGDVKIVDFGIAKTSEAAVGESTQAGQLKGKVPYMSPEQASGKMIDHRSDIFAVGIMLFELTTGRRLFKAKSEFETLKLICERDYPRPSQIRPNYPKQLEAVVMKALAKDPDERYQSARDMQADIEAFVREDRIAVSAVSIANWMKMLFEDKIAEQKEALQDVKQLADVIASQRTQTDIDLFATNTMMAVNTGTGSGTDISSIYTATSPAPKGRKWLGVVAVLLVAAGGAGAFFATQGTEAANPDLGTTSATPTPQPAAEPEPPKRGKLVVNSTPSGAYIRIAGELQGDKTPTTIDKVPLNMDVEVKLSLDGYETVTKTVRLSDSKLEDEVRAELTKGSSTIKYSTRPAGVSVHLDGKLWTGGDTIENLSEGDHKLIFSAPGHVPQVVKLTTKKGETRKIDIVLQKGDASGPPKPGPAQPPPPANDGPPGTVNVASTGGFCSNVIVGGRSVGPTPVAGISVKPGPVGITCKTSDGRSIPSGANVKSGETTRVTIPIPPP